MLMEFFIIICHDQYFYLKSYVLQTSYNFVEILTALWKFFFLLEIYHANSPQAKFSTEKLNFWILSFSRPQPALSKK